MFDWRHGIKNEWKIVKNGYYANNEKKWTNYLIDNQ